MFKLNRQIFNLVYSLFLSSALFLNLSCQGPTTSIPPRSTVYKWKKLALPGASDIQELGDFAVSGDNKHIYAYFSAFGNVGLYYSGDNGNNWTKLAILSGQPFRATQGASGEPAKAELDTGFGIDELKPTDNGAVVSQDKKIVILVGKEVNWALDAEKHYATAPENADRVKNLEDKNITFIDVVTTASGETVVFGQGQNDKVFFHSTVANFEDAPQLFATKKTDGNALLVTWIVAGNTHDGNLLLGSEDGVWEFPQAHTNLDPTNSNIGRAADNSARIFPEGKEAWDKDGINKNVNIRVVGSFNDGGDQHYFAGMNQGSLSEQAAKFGLAHHKGPQSNNHASLDFSEHRIFGLVNYVGKWLLRTDKGLKGVNVDGTPNQANDYKFDPLANDKNEMMEDGSAVVLGSSDNENLGAIFGDDDKTWYLVFNEGLFRRTKESGTPRP